MLDYNHRPSFAEQVNAAVDAVLTAENATRAPRDYLGGSRIGHACERALQFEFTATPKDEGQEFSGQLLRIFSIGHSLEDLAVAWLRGAGFDLYTRKGKRPDGGQFGFSAGGGRVRGHVDGIIAAGPKDLELPVPVLWECKTMAGTTPVVVTTTNQPGGMAFSIGVEAAAQGSVYEKLLDPVRAIMASAQNTATTIVAPLTTSVIWRISATFYVAP